MTRARWILWGGAAAIGVAAIVLAAVLWLVPAMRLPSDALLVPRDAATLQDALARVAPGGTIVIQRSAGPIAGPVLIAVSDVTLVSSGGRWTLTGAGQEPALSIQADGVRIQGFEIAAESIGIQVKASDCVLGDIRVEGAPIGIQLDGSSRCVVRSVETYGGGVGIELSNSNGTLCDDCRVVNASECGVRVIASRNNSLTRLHLSGTAVGISMEQQSSANTVDVSRIEQCTIAGVEIRSANDNTILNTSMESVRVGVMLEGVTGTHIQGCDIRGSSVSGILLQQAIQNRIEENEIRASQGTGIQLTQSAKNALLYNEVSDCGASAMHLASSARNLIMGNLLDRSQVGLQLVRSDENRILRNRSANSALSGVAMMTSNSNRVLDNTSDGGGHGFVLAESRANTLLRNSASRGDGAGFLLASTLGGNYVAENQSTACVWGTLLVASSRDSLAQNSIADNDVGILLADLGGGTRIEGNMIRGNRIGLRQLPDAAELAEVLGVLNLALPTENDGSLPILTNNIFRANTSLDIQNDSPVLLLAAGNWWGATVARDSQTALLSDGVSLEQSAWKGTVAIGTGSEDVRVLLGRILQWTLVGEGFRVIDLIGMGASDRVRQALVDADVDLIWCNGSALEDPVYVAGVPAVSLPSSAVEGWRIVVSARVAGQVNVPTVSGLAMWCRETGESLRFASTSSLGDEAFTSFLSVYGLDGFVRSSTASDALDEVEALLKFGAVDVAIVGSLEETLTLSGFLAMEDDRHALGQQPLTIVVQPSIQTRYGEMHDILVDLEARLTTDAVHNLVSRIRLLGLKPEDVAREFLQQ